ncbi:MAG: hypothetical protein V2J65_08640 [Desulfobacteraceae bacterium]|nr:hypothetical protein [Desulfobacteraceae bacterium]
MIVAHLRGPGNFRQTGLCFVVVFDIADGGFHPFVIAALFLVVAHSHGPSV